jgi:tetrapyrrole methylase family protein/MazG family protein
MDMEALQEELGDLLLQVVLQAQIATEGGDFSMPQVIEAIYAKLVRRHPHVFGDLTTTGVDQVLANWETLKAGERAERGGKGGLLDGVPPALPALAQAGEIQARVVRVGFDWPTSAGARAKILEELQEVDQAPVERRSDELGDLLFAVVNYARWLNVDAEAALRIANERFRARFSHLEATARKANRPLSDHSLEEMEALWREAKRAEG